MVMKGGTCYAGVRYLGQIGWIKETGPKEMSSFSRVGGPCVPDMMARACVL